VETKGNVAAVVRYNIAKSLICLAGVAADEGYYHSAIFNCQQQSA
jgi:HEPN domain-containing protein